jgi:hypothetical protein
MSCSASEHAPELAPLVDRPGGEQQVRGERRVEDDRDRREAPEQEEPDAGGFQRLQRDQPAGVIEEVRQDVGEQHEAAAQPRLPHQKRQ